jgi:subtilisin family serine protease
VPLQAGTADVDLSPADDGLLRSAERLPENVQRYGADANPGWVVRVDTEDATNATDALRDWTNASDERVLIDTPSDAGYAVVSAPRGDVGVTLLTRTLNSGLAYNDYILSVEPETTMSVPEPDALASNETWSPTASQRLAEWTTRGDNFGTEGVAWREDVNGSTMQEARQATRSDTLDAAANGTGVTVAVLDTGINTQSGQVFGNGSGGSEIRVDNASKNFLTGESVNATAGDYAAVADGNGHGTWVASAIASAAAEPYRGYAPDANLLVLKVLGDDGSGSTHSIAEAVRYAAEQDADVISMSLGAPTYSAELAEAVANATEQGSTVVIAAGNSRQTTRWVGSPADTPAEGVLTVGAASVNTNNTTDVASTLPAHFSQIGPDPGTVDLSSGVTNGEGIDLVAPGMKVTAATPTTSGTRSNTSLSGTSMATPMVAGAIAQVLDQRPDWKDDPAGVAGYARNTTRVMPNGSVSAVGHGYLAADQLAAAEEHDETQADARTDAARARDAGWRTLSNGSGGFFARVLARTSTAVGVA